jgi:pimeloyl-ACP methyl ester carboxylesterase
VEHFPFCYIESSGMLPSQYLLSDEEFSSRNLLSSNTYRSLTGPSSLPQRPPPPLGITGVVCTSQMIELPNDRGKLHCTIYRPRMMEQRAMSDNTATIPPRSRPKLPQPNPPLICVAGGPGMPCQYLTAMVHLIPDRAVVLYDHIGCGQSTSASSSRSNNDSSVNSASSSSSSSFLENTVSDLAVLIEAIVPMHTSFHLFGHSMGGIIAYEYVKRRMSTEGGGVGVGRSF